MAEQVMPKSSQVDIRLEDVIVIALKWKWVVLFFALTISVTSLLMMLMVKPVYTATSLVSVKSRTPESQTLGGRFITTREPLNPLDEELFIRSRMVLSDVARELNLDIVFKKEEKFVDLILDLLKGKRRSEENYGEFVSQISLDGSASRGLWLDFHSRLEFSITTAEGEKRIGAGRIGELFTSDEATFLIDDFPHKAQDRFFLQQRDLEVVTRQLATAVNVSPLAKSSLRSVTLPLEMSVTSNSPTTAVRLANTIAEVYLKRKLEEAGETIGQVLRFMDEQMLELKVRTEDSIQNVEEYREREGLFFVDESAKSKLLGISQLDLESNNMELRVSVLSSLLGSIKQGSEITSKQIMLISVTEASVAAQIARRINDLELERKALERKYTTKHPDMLANEGKIIEARKMLIEALESHVELINEKISTNNRASDRYGQELRELNEGLRNINRIERVSLINEYLLNYLMRRNEEAKIQKASIIANVKIVRQAFSANLVKPQKNKYIISGILAGLLVGIGISFLLESMDKSIKSPSWVEKELSLPVYGMIPNFNPRKGQKKPTTVGERTMHLIIQHDPKSMIAESYRALRTNIQFADLENKPKILLFTSPAPREGKSTTIANLAITMANSGNKVLIFDADLRKPIMHRFFNLAKEGGITDVLTRGADWKEQIKSTNIENCFVMTSGKSPPNPSELLGSKKMKELLNKAREEFDIIFIDSSPTIPVTDAVVMAPEVDAVFLVFEMGRTTTLAAAASMGALSSVHVKPTGAIINNIRPEDRRAYGYGYRYGYGYGYKYGYGYGYGYKYYRYYDQYSYYYGDDKKPPKTRMQKLLEKLSGRKDDEAA